MDVSSLSQGWGNHYCPSCGTTGKGEEQTESKPANSISGKELSTEEQKQVTELKKRDKEVKAHEAAHIAAGGQYVRGGAHYEYQTGPDGRKYAVGGEVPIDTSSVQGDPAATIRKMQVVKAAALAPAEPSGADRAIAAKASMEAAKAQSELLEEKQAAQSGDTTPGAKGIQNQIDHSNEPMVSNAISKNVSSPYPVIKTPHASVGLDIMA